MVYFLQSPFGGPIKIGHTKFDVESRRRYFASQTKGPLKILKIIVGDQRAEREIHVRFASLRIGRTEWFESSPDLVAYIGTGLLSDKFCEHRDPCVRFESFDGIPRAALFEVSISFYLYESLKALALPDHRVQLKAQAILNRGIRHEAEEKGIYGRASYGDSSASVFASWDEPASTG